MKENNREGQNRPDVGSQQIEDKKERVDDVK